MKGFYAESLQQKKQQTGVAVVPNVKGVFGGVESPWIEKNHLPAKSMGFETF